jgi:hypothetical protein
MFNIEQAKKIQKGGVEEYLYSFFNFGARCGGCQRHFQGALPGTNDTGGWVGPRVGLDESENLAHIGTRPPDSLSNSSVAIPTDLSRPTQYKYSSLNCTERQPNIFKITEFFV